MIVGDSDSRKSASMGNNQHQWSVAGDIYIWNSGIPWSPLALTYYHVSPPFFRFQQYVRRMHVQSTIQKPFSRLLKITQCVYFIVYLPGALAANLCIFFSSIFPWYSSVGRIPAVETKSTQSIFNIWQVLQREERPKHKCSWSILGLFLPTRYVQAQLHLYFVTSFCSMYPLRTYRIWLRRCAWCRWRSALDRKTTRCKGRRDSHQ